MNSWSQEGLPSQVYTTHVLILYVKTNGGMFILVSHGISLSARFLMNYHNDQHHRHRCPSFQRRCQLSERRQSVADLNRLQLAATTDDSCEPSTSTDTS